MSANFVLLSGKLQKEPYFQYRDSKNGQGKYGQACYTLICSQRGTDGKLTEKMFDIDVYGRLAEEARDYLHQGSYVTLRGILRPNSYTTKRGETINTPALQWFEQESYEIPEQGLTGMLAGPEMSHELPERAAKSDDPYEYAGQNFF